jgi:hypothetical protein
MAKKVGELVEANLKKYPESRGSDKILIQYVLSDLGFHMSAEQWEIFSSVSLESITRARRKFNSEGKYMPDDDTFNERQAKATRVHLGIIKTAPVDVPQLIMEK